MHRPPGDVHNREIQVPLSLVPASRLFYDLPLLLRQSVELVHQVIDLPVRRLDLPLNHRLLMLQRRVVQEPVQVEHLCDEGHHPVVPGGVGWVVEVRDVDGVIIYRRWVLWAGAWDRG